VGKLIVGDLRLLAETGAASISVTAEQWVSKPTKIRQMKLTVLGARLSTEENMF